MKETQETAIVPSPKTTTAIPEPTADLIKNSFPQSPISPSKNAPVVYTPQYDTSPRVLTHAYRGIQSSPQPPNESAQLPFYLDKTGQKIGQLL